MTHEYIREFWDSVNEHSNAKYKTATGPRGTRGQGFVIEAERHKHRDGPDRGHLRVWQRPADPADPREAKWGKKWEFTGTWEETLEEYGELDSKAAVLQRIES